MILFDESHSEFCTISEVKKKRSYAVWERSIKKEVTPLTSRKEFMVRLSQATVMVIAEPHSYFALDETRALIDFVFQGGSLVLVGNHHNTPRYYSYGCNEILNVISSPFGMRFNDDGVVFNGENVILKFSEHPVCRGVRLLHYWRGCSITLLRQRRRYAAEGVASGSRHDVSEVYRKEPVVAALHEKKGKVFCLGDSSVWSDPGEEVEDDNFLFAENVIKWALTDKG
ncbi:MAG: DUF4350 domain-containing protein [Theionarchaea archaeon]|nr:DUF4350 domain-containing protein [Theionarchaea archaeon]